MEIQENFVLVKLTDRFNGIIPKRELSEEFLKDISEKFSIGDKVEAVAKYYSPPIIEDKIAWTGDDDVACHHHTS